MADKKSERTHNKSSKEKIAIEEADLWEKISGSVKPIADKSKNRVSPANLPTLENKKTLPSKKNVVQVSPHTKANKKQKKLPREKQGPQLTGIDRRSKQKLLRGNVIIDAHLDLHGASQIEARGMLKNFLSRSQKNGANIVLVITGKGASPYTRHVLHSHANYNAPEREGILRQNFPEWMKEREFTEFVSGFQPAHPKHGGGGAFYVKIRKLKPK